MDAEDQISFYTVQQKIELMAEILRDLSLNHDFHFNLSYALLAKHTKRILTFSRLINNNINVPILGLFIEDLELYKQEKGNICTLIASGRVVVLCTDDTAKPEGIKDWPVKGFCYLVESVYTTHDGGNIVRLAGLNPDPFKGYKSDRFIQLFNQFNQN